MAPGLGARALLEEQHLAPVEVDAGSSQGNGELEREDDVAVHVLVERVPITFVVAQHERRRTRLAVLVAHAHERGVRRRKRRLAEPSGPPVRDLRHIRIRGGAQFRDHRRQGVAVVAVTTLAETVSRHVDSRAELGIVVERAHQRRALGCVEKW